MNVTFTFIYDPNIHYFLSEAEEKKLQLMLTFIHIHVITRRHNLHEKRLLELSCPYFVPECNARRQHNRLSMTQIN